MLKNEKHVEVKSVFDIKEFPEGSVYPAQELKEEILNKTIEMNKFNEKDLNPNYEQELDGLRNPAESLDLKMVIEYSPWKLEQFAIKEQEKEDNQLELAYYFKEQHGQLTRNVPVYTPKRLLEVVRAEGKDTYKDRYVTKQKSKHKKTA